MSCPQAMGFIQGSSFALLGNKQTNWAHVDQNMAQGAWAKC